MRHLLMGLLLCTSAGIASAQNDILGSLRTQRAGQGVVTLVQDARLDALLGKPLVTLPAGENGDKAALKVPGFRVQVYAGNNSRAARNEATALSEKVREQFPELPVYTHFVNPRWLCRVGDFHSIEEADAVMRKLKATGLFREVSIVRGQINVPY